jgi:hypothetical protein
MINIKENAVICLGYPDPLRIQASLVLIIITSQTVKTVLW